ncbi:MAG: HAD family hydrolase, partial [Brevinema sp.]
MVDPRSIKAVAVDCDGTLINSQEQLTPRTIEALKAVLATGRQVYMATGRSVDAAKKIALNAGISRYMVNYNGAVLWNLETDSVAKEVTIQPHVSQGLVELLKHTDVDYLFYENGEAYYEVERPFMTTYIQRLGKLGLVPKHTNFTGFPFEHTQKCMVFGSDESVEAVVKTIQASYGDDLNLLVSRPYTHNQVVDIRY